VSLAMIFPGQGSQAVGMLGALAVHSPLVRATFDEASTVLGFDLWQMVAEGPPETLNATENTQPAMLAAGVAVWRVWQERGAPRADIVSGHSLGEFTALVCASALRFQDAIALVHFRGRIMQEAVPAGTGAMAAVLGLSDDEVQAVCTEAAAGEIVEPVNFNSPGQVVIAGHAAAVQRAVAIAKAHGSKHAVLLRVSVPAHSSLMRDAARRLEARLESTAIEAPAIRYVSAVDALVHTEPQDIRATLVRQLASPVRWSQTVRAINAQGASSVIECGPGRVLTGLNKRIERRSNTQYAYIEDSESINAALSALQAGGPHAGV
jgi:[acyl-carrier-protein] S-malonyltransferase